VGPAGNAGPFTLRTFLADSRPTIDIPRIGHERFDAFIASSKVRVVMPTAAEVGLGRTYVFRSMEGTIDFGLPGADTVDGLRQFAVASGRARTLLSDGKSMWIQIADHN
jgi:hypothetical protein